VEERWLWLVFPVVKAEKGKLNFQEGIWRHCVSRAGSRRGDQGSSATFQGRASLQARGGILN
jgi:hypothetical protein